MQYFAWKGSISIVESSGTFGGILLAKEMVTSLVGGGLEFSGSGKWNLVFGGNTQGNVIMGSGV